MVAPWDSLPAAKPDPIFALAMQARAAGPQAIDATLGVFVDDSGQTPLLPSVKAAMESFLPDYAEGNFSYTSLLGLPEYRDAVKKLVFGEESQHIACIATTGGSGALAINLRLLRLMRPDSKLCIGGPAWANHAPLCRNARIEPEEVSLICEHTVDVSALIDWISSNPDSAVLLQVSCSNPTGLDCSKGHWEEIVSACKKKNSIALLDFAYQGFASSPEEEAKVVQKFVENDVATLVCWSAAKNHGIYRLRAGAAFASTPNADICKQVEAQYSMLSRGLWSSAPAFGQQLVATVQNDFYDDWTKDLENIRSTLTEKRAVLKENLPSEFSVALSGNGLFARLPLTPQQIQTLRSEHTVFLLEDGRINIPGIAKHRLEAFCEKVNLVLG